MTEKTTMQSILEGLKEHRTGLSLCLAGLMALETYDFALRSINDTAVNSPTIESIGQLEKMIENKKQKRGFTKKITARVDYSGKEAPTAQSQKLKDGSYEIVFNKEYLKFKVLDHELYHIFDGDCDDASGNQLRYQFYYEPKAAIKTLLEK